MPRKQIGLKMDIQQLERIDAAVKKIGNGYTRTDFLEEAAEAKLKTQFVPPEKEESQPSDPKKKGDLRAGAELVGNWPVSVEGSRHA